MRVKLPMQTLLDVQQLAAVCFRVFKGDSQGCHAF